MADVYRSLALANSSMFRSSRIGIGSNTSLSDISREHSPGREAAENAHNILDHVDDGEIQRSRSNSIDASFAAIWRNDLEGSAASGKRRNTYDALAAQKWKDKRKERVFLKEMRVRRVASFGSGELPTCSFTSPLTPASTSAQSQSNGLDTDVSRRDSGYVSIAERRTSRPISISVTDTSTDDTNASPTVPTININGQRASPSALIGLMRHSMSRHELGETLRQSLAIGQAGIESLLSDVDTGQELSNSSQEGSNDTADDSVDGLTNAEVVTPPPASTSSPSSGTFE